MTAAIYAGEKYVDDEIEYLVENYPTLGRAAVARELGRTPCAVGMAALKYGVRKLSKFGLHEAEFRRLHAAGLSDRQIGVRIGIDKRTVQTWRKRCGLPARQSQSDGGKKTQQILKAKAAAHGQRTWADRMRVLSRIRADSQFRGCVTPTQVEVCRLLEKVGPMTWTEVVQTRGESRARHTSSALVDLLSAGVLRKIDGRYSINPLDERRNNRTEYHNRKHPRGGREK